MILGARPPPSAGRPEGPNTRMDGIEGIWPGSAYPLGATYDGAGTNFAVFSEVADRVELCLFDPRGRETRYDLPEVDALRLARLPARHRAGPALRLPGARPARPGPRASVQPQQAAGRPVRQGRGRRDPLERGAVRLPVRRAEPAQQPEQREVHGALRRVEPVLRLGRRPAPAHPVPRDGHLRGARQGPDDRPPRHPARHPRHVRGARAPGDAPAPEEPRASPPSNSCPCTSSCTTSTWWTRA